MTNTAPLNTSEGGGGGGGRGGGGERGGREGGGGVEGVFGFGENIHVEKQ